MLSLVELADRADEEVRYLRGGMQQKVALAAALLHNPKVLLLDEPTLGLDVQAARTIELVIRNFVEANGKTVLLTTHQMALAERLCNQIFVINKGTKVAEGPTSEVIVTFGGERQTLEIQLDTQVDGATLARLQTVFPELHFANEGNRNVFTLTDNTSQAEFLHLLNLLNQEGLTILQAGRRAATLEEVFVQLTSGQEESHGK